MTLLLLLLLRRAPLSRPRARQLRSWLPPPTALLLLEELKRTEAREAFPAEAGSKSWIREEEEEETTKRSRLSQ